MIINTGIYTVTSSAYSIMACKRYIRKNWWWMFIPILIALVCIINGILDLRFFIIVAMFFFLIYPAILANIYLSCSLSPEVILNLNPHKICFTDHEFTIYRYKRHEKEDDQEIPPVIESTLSVRYTDIDDLSVNKSQIVLWYDDKQFIIVPNNVFPSDSDYRMIINMIYSSNKQ